jgi:hypothetical protein
MAIIYYPSIYRHQLGWVLKDKNPTTPRLHEDKFFTHPRGDFSNSPLESGRGVFIILIKKIKIPVDIFKEVRRCRISLKRR